MKHAHLLKPQCPAARLLAGCVAIAGVLLSTAAGEVPARRIVLEPEAGAMQVRARVPALGNQVFALGIPETIGGREALLVMSKQGRPFHMSETTRVKGHMPTVGFYLPEHVAAGTESVFVRGFGATSPDRTDGSWIVTLSEPAGSYMAAAATETAFLFDNLARCCLHAAPSFGDIGPGEASTAVSRLYLAKGTLEEFQKRLETERQTPASGQRWARPAKSSETAKPHGRMEEMSPDELERVLDTAPIAFVPVGTFEHHGWHLPVCFDGIKAHALCERVAERTGGTVLPTIETSIALALNPGWVHDDVT